MTTTSAAAPIVLPPHNNDLVTITKDGAKTTYAAPLWLLDLVGLTHLRVTTPADLLTPATFVATTATDHKHAEDGIAKVRAIMSQPIPASLDAHAAAALASLSTGPQTLWTRDEWYALPHPSRGLCLKYLPQPGAPKHVADTWGFAVLTDLGRRTLAQHQPLVA